MASNWALELNGGHDDDAALSQAIAMSLGEEQAPEDSSRAPGFSRAAESSNTEAHAASGSLSSLSALGLDRKKMEEERLARLRKRKADADGALDTNGAPEPRRQRLLEEQPAGLSSTTPPTSQKPVFDISSESRKSNATSEAAPTARLAYAQGAVLKTWAHGVARGRDIKIEEVFQKDELELAVLSSFQWDEEWLMTKLNVRKTRVLLIAFAQNEQHKAEMRNNVPKDFIIRFAFPPMDGVAGCMHSKLQLLKYPKYLRIVVPSGNLVPYDWGETGVMENMVFLIDLPRIEDPAKRATNVLTTFGQDLAFFLGAQGVDEKMVDSLQNYDFAETSRYGFIHTIAGSHPDPQVWQRTGYCGLGRSVEALGLSTAESIDMDYVCSSIGAVNQDLLTALHNACQGDSGMREFEARAGKQRKGKNAVSAATDPKDDKNIRVYYPSKDTVSRSRGGPDSAGTICFQKKWWESSTFPREVLRDCVSVRAGMLMHSKILFVRRPAADSHNECPGWAYVGSHNLSESAWGRLVKDRKADGKPKLNARNWECGVLIPLPTATSATSATSASNSPHGRAGRKSLKTLDIFAGTIPVPMELPGSPFLNSEKQPWFSREA